MSYKTTTIEFKLKIQILLVLIYNRCKREYLPHLHINVNPMHSLQEGRPQYRISTYSITLHVIKLF